MALLFCDGFDSYAATADLTKKWALAPSPWAWSSTGGPDGGGCVTGTTSVVALSSFNSVLGATTRICVGFFLKISVSGLSSQYIFRLYDTAGLAMVQLRTHSGAAGNLEAINSGGNQTINGVRNVCDNQWHWIELDINTAVSQPIRLFVDGVQDFNGYQFSMAGSLLQRFVFQTVSGATISIANVIIWDNAGSTLNAASFPLGPRDITTLRPNGDGTVQFARSTGSTSHTLLDEVNGDTTDYVQSGTNGEQDLYDYGALGFTPTFINSVMLNSYLHNPSVGLIHFQNVCKSGSTTSAGTSTMTPPIAARVVQTAYDADPNGSIAWTQANLDAAQFGIKAVTV